MNLANAAQPGQADILAGYRNQARFAIMEQNYPQALEFVDKALQLEPRNQELLLLKLKALKESAGSEKALEFLRGLWAKDEAAYGYLRFEAGYIRVRDQKYDKALIHFKHAEKIDRQRAIREQGLTYLRMKDYPQALTAFKRLDQESASTLYLMGQTLYAQKDHDGAKQALQKALTSKPTNKEVKDIEFLLKGLEVAQKAERPWRAYATVLSQYDDNVFRDPSQSYPGAQPTRGRGDFMFLFKQDLLYRLGRLGDLTWGVSGQLQYVTFAKLQDANYASWSAGGYLDYLGAKWGFHLPYTYSYYWAQSNLLRKVAINGLQPTLWLLHSPNWRSEFNGLIQHRGYLQPGNPDAWRWRAGLTHYLSKDPTLLPHLRLGYAISQEIASDEASGFLTWEASLGGAVPLLKKLSLDLSLTYLKYVFDRRVDPYLLGQSGGEMDRQDHQLQANAQLIYRPASDWQLTLGYMYNLNGSNVHDYSGFEPYDFRKNTVSLMLIWSF